MDFSSNLHPQTAPEKILAEALAGVEDSAGYPDPNADSLRAVLSERWNLPAEQILAGPGSVSLLYLILRILNPKSVLIPIPCFSEYPYAASRAGAKVSEHAADLSGVLGAPPKLEPHTCVILSNPCNPTGRIVPPDTLREWMAAVKKAEGHLILDEAYADFVDGGAPEHSAKVFSSFPLIVLRSPLKFYTLPGLRSGLAILPAGLAEHVSADIPPWPLSAPASLATLAAVNLDPDIVHRRRRQIRNWADTFYRAIATVPEISSVQSDVHFFLIRLPKECMDGFSLAKELALEGMWIRTSAGMPGLGAHDIRVSTRLPEENGKLISSLKRIYKQPVSAT